MFATMFKDIFNKVSHVITSCNIRRIVIDGSNRKGFMADRVGDLFKRPTPTLILLHGVFMLRYFRPCFWTGRDLKKIKKIFLDFSDDWKGDYLGGSRWGPSTMRLNRILTRILVYFRKNSIRKCLINRKRCFTVHPAKYLTEFTVKYGAVVGATAWRLRVQSSFCQHL